MFEILLEMAVASEKQNKKISLKLVNSKI